jgi:hypothetical protein
MKAEELRIGNWIQDLECEPYYFQIEELQKHVGHEIWAYYRNGSIKANEVEGIPLTEEWLLKFGFQRHHEDYFNNVIYIKDVVGKTKFEWGVYPKGIGSGHIVKDCVLLEHVHQLQNLIHALTGEELTLTES